MNCHDVPMSTGTSPAPADDQDPRQAKSRLRAQLRARRAAVEPSQRASAAHGFERALSQLLAEHPRGPVLAFLPLPDEPPLTAALRRILEQREVLLPVTQPRRRMLWSRWSPGTEFAPSGPGGLREPIGERIPAPQTPGVVLVPALALGEDGVRLGMGGGFYDTFLEQLPPETARVGCVHSWEVLPAGAVPAEPWDARLPLALTERGLRELTAATA